MARLARVAGCLALLLAAGPALAQGIEVTVDRAEATVEDQLVLTVTVEGSQEARPQPPSLPDFGVHPQGTSREVRMINGQVTANLIYTYVLLPKRTGTLPN